MLAWRDLCEDFGSNAICLPAAARLAKSKNWPIFFVREPATILGMSAHKGGIEMKIPAYAIYIAALSLGALLPPGLSAAQYDSPNGPEKPSIDRTAMIQASVFPLQPTQNQSNYILAKSNKSSDQLACEAQCRKAYRRCYSQGNKIGTPEVHGGQPCSEQKVMCLRACPQ